MRVVVHRFGIVEAMADGLSTLKIVRMQSTLRKQRWKRTKTSMCCLCSSLDPNPLRQSRVQLLASVKSASARADVTRGALFVLMKSAHSKPDSSVRKAVRLGVLCCWLAAIGVGFAGLARHQWTPGDVQSGTRDQGSLESLGIPRGVKGSIVLFAHPRCPCTPTSLRALADLTPAGGWGRAGIALSVVFVRPANASGPEWAAGRSRELAGEIAGAEIIDLDEPRAAPLGVRTSGHVLAYDARGGTVLDGGITPGRAHEGGCEGLTALRDLVRGGVRADGHAAPARTDVFGCALMDQTQPRAGSADSPTDERPTAACCATAAGSGATP